jgi:hypothetical protein
LASTKQTKTITPRAVVHRDVKLANLRRAMYGKRRDLLVEDPAVDFAGAAQSTWEQGEPAIQAGTAAREANTAAPEASPACVAGRLDRYSSRSA